MVSMSMYSRMSGPTPLRTSAGTAAVTWSRVANGASTVVWWAGRGYTLSSTWVTMAKVPSEPMMSWVRS
jgi:hypothetical protein